MSFIKSISKALLLLAMAMCAQNSFAQDFTSIDTLKFYDALQFRMIIKGGTTQRLHISECLLT